MSAVLSITCQTCGARLDAARSEGVCAICLFGEALEQDLSETFGGHELRGIIARGGMGVVYRATQREPRREVALKTLRGAELDSPEAQTRFRDEARTMAGLDHPGILPIYQFGQQDGVLFFTMKLAAGGSLAERLADYAGKWRKTAELIVSVANAVQFAHEHGVLHRDIKPGNILFDEDGHAFVSDFGLAKLADSADGGMTGSAAMLGTPHYMAPEIAEHGLVAATTATDVWSIGVVFHELLAQRRPFEADSLHALLRAISETDPAPFPCGVADDLRVIALKALARGPERRYASPRELGEDLQRWLSGRPILARRVTATERAVLWMKRNPALAFASGLAGFAVVAAIVALAWGLEWAREEAKTAAAARDQISIARDESQQQLRNALVERAKSGRNAAIVGWRESGLSALRQANEIRSGADVRSEALAHLVGFDLVCEPERATFGGLSADARFSAHFLEVGKTYVAFADRTNPGLTWDVPLALPPTATRFAVDCRFDPSQRFLAVVRGSNDPFSNEIAIVDIPGRSVIGLTKGGFGGFSADGSVFAALTASGQVNLYRSADLCIVGKLLATPDRLPWQWCLLQPEGDSALMVCGQAETLEVWNWRESKLVFFRRTSVALPRLAWAGDMVMATSKVSGFEGLAIDARSGVTRSLTADLTDTYAVALLQKGGLYCAGSLREKSTIIADTITGRTLLRGSSFCPASWVGDGRSFVDDQGRISALTGSEALQTERLSVVPPPTALDISPDGRWLLLSGQGVRVVVMDMRTRAIVAVPPASSSREKAKFLPDSRHIALIRAEKRTIEHRLELQIGELQVSGGYLEVSLPDPIAAVEIERNKGALAGCLLADRNRALLIRHGISSDDALLVSPLIPDTERQVISLTNTPSLRAGLIDDRFGYVFSRAGMQRYSLQSHTLETMIGANPEPEMISVVFSPDQRWACGRTKVYDVNTWTPRIAVSAMSRYMSENRPLAAWSPDSARLITSPNQIDLEIVNVRTGEQEVRLCSPRRCTVQDMQFTPDGHTVVVLRDGGIVEFWDLAKLASGLFQQGINWEFPPAVQPSPGGIADFVTPMERPLFSGGAPSSSARR